MEIVRLAVVNKTILDVIHYRGFCLKNGQFDTSLIHSKVTFENNDDSGFVQFNLFCIAEMPEKLGEKFKMCSDITVFPTDMAVARKRLLGYAIPTEILKFMGTTGLHWQHPTQGLINSYVWLLFTTNSITEDCSFCHQIFSHKKTFEYQDHMPTTKTHEHALMRFGAKDFPFKNVPRMDLINTQRGQFKATLFGKNGIICQTIQRLLQKHQGNVEEVLEKFKRMSITCHQEEEEDPLKTLTVHKLLNWLLFDSLPTMHGVWDNESEDLHVLLVKAIYILMGDNITMEEAVEADQLLKLYIKKLKGLHGKEALTMEIHSLLHLADSVRWTGSIASAIPFMEYERQVEGRIVELLSYKTSAAKPWLQVAETMLMYAG